MIFPLILFALNFHSSLSFLGCLTPPPPTPPSLYKLSHLCCPSCKKKRISNIHKIVSVQSLSMINDKYLRNKFFILMVSKRSFQGLILHGKLEFINKFNVVVSFQNLENIWKHFLVFFFIKLFFR